jgi:hypothetical protein
MFGVAQCHSGVGDRCAAGVGHRSGDRTDRLGLFALRDDPRGGRAVAVH